jgi:hypothetical protein
MRGRYRKRLRRRFPSKTYGQRWQIETVISMLKRLMGSSLRARRYHSQCREIRLRVITLNVMILLCVSIMFIQSRTGPVYLAPDLCFRHGNFWIRAPLAQKQSTTQKQGKTACI